MGRYIHKPYLDKTKLTLPVEKGGTAAYTIEDAVQNLDILTVDKIGVVNGVANLDSNGKVITALLPEGVGSEVTIDGSLSVSIGYTTEYLITNYDSYINYTITADRGTITVNDNVITYTAPATVGTDTITINGRGIDLFIVSPRPNKPIIVSPIENSTLSRDVTIVTSSYDSLPQYSHASTDWEVSTDSGFNTIMKGSYNDAVNLTTWTTTDLSPLTAYFVRVKFRDSEGNESLWSDTVRFNTKGTYVESYKYLSSNGQASDGLGYVCAISADGNTVAAHSFNGDMAVGSVNVISKSNGIWNEQTITSPYNPVETSSAAFGNSLSLSDDGNTLIIGAPLHEADLISTGRAYVYLRTGTTWSLQASLISDDVGDSDAFGHSVAVSSDGNTAVISSPSHIVGPNSVGAVYVFTRTGSIWTQQSKLLALDANNNANFGTSVAISADGSTVLVGSDGASDNTGAAYVYKKSGSTWIEQAKLTASDGAIGNYFGWSVDITADGNTAVIGSPSSNSVGAVYVFTRTGSTWTEHTILPASNLANDDQFGSSVAISKDGKTIVVGNYSDDNEKGTNAGSIQLFKYNINSWSFIKTIVALDGGNTDFFGHSLDVSNDGTTIVVGADGDSNSNGTAAGSVYILDELSTFYPENEVSKLTANNGAIDDFFGHSVAISADGNTVVIGAYGDDNANGTDSGCAYIYSKINGIWSQKAQLITLTGLSGDNLGWSVDISADGNTVILGAPKDDDKGADSGAAYIFVYDTDIDMWNQEIKISPTNLAAGDNFGHSVAISADGTKVVIGSPNDDDIATSTGSIYVFTKSGASWGQQKKLTAYDASGSSQLGWSVDISADGSTLISGANYNNSSTGAAYIFVYDVDIGMWIQEDKLIGSDSSSGDQFGWSVALSANGNVAIVGSQYDDIGTVDNGSAYIFTRTAGIWTQSIKLTSSDLTASSYFGISVDISANGNIVAIGARNVNGIGAVYIFTSINGLWVLRKKIVGSDSSSGDSFGQSVSISGDGTDLIAGAHMEDPLAGSNAGSVYLFN